MGVRYFWSRRATPLFFYKYFRLEKRTEIIGALVGHARLYRLDAFVSSGRIKIQAVTACMQIGAAILALVRYADLVHDLDFRSAIVAACNQVELRFHSSAGAFGTRKRFRLPFPF